jgi:hypothetical protein
LSTALSNAWAKFLNILGVKFELVAGLFTKDTANVSFWAWTCIELLPDCLGTIGHQQWELAWFLSFDSAGFGGGVETGEARTTGVVAMAGEHGLRAAC